MNPQGLGDLGIIDLALRLPAAECVAFSSPRVNSYMPMFARRPSTSCRALPKRCPLFPFLKDLQKRLRNREEGARSILRLVRTLVLQLWALVSLTAGRYSLRR